MNYGYSVITLLSSIIGCVFSCAIQTELTELRIGKKAAGILIPVFTVFYTALVIVVYLLLGPETGGQFFIAFTTLPIFVFFFLISYYRNGKFFFSFFSREMVVLLIICLTNLLDSYFPTDGHLVHSLLRIVIFPLVFFITHRFLAPHYRRIQNTIPEGWNISAFIIALSFFLVLYAYNYPSLLYKRPWDIPVFIGLTVISILFIISSVASLNAVQERNEAQRRTQLLYSQSEAVKSLIEQTKLTEKRLRTERHDLRHRYNTISTLLKDNDIAGALSYIDSSAGHLDETRRIIYCRNTVINATVTAYAAIAENYGITLHTEIDIPDDLDINSEELSVVFANALENAINSVKEMPEEKRTIYVKAISDPQLMLQIKNPAGKHVRFDSGGFPISNRRGHGLGVWSINSYCEKNNAVCEYSVQDDMFIFRLGHLSGEPVRE